MSLLSRPLISGNLVGVVYDFENTGDELPRHNHNENDIHISIVARGRIRAFGDGWEIEAPSGAVLDWEPGQYHGFIAIEPNSRLVNIVKGAK
jgi:quercetin dioxygenase-like cupin family protein